jgi:hypothetical protein
MLPNLRRAGKFKVSLYDLETDIGKEHNLAEQHPEVVEKLLGFLNNAGI